MVVADLLYGFDLLPAQHQIILLQYAAVVPRQAGAMFLHHREAEVLPPEEAAEDLRGVPLPAGEAGETNLRRST